jgi:4-hydroxythreonine-4-phosphate dehydrogenase
MDMRPIVAISMGDPAGIGAEVAVGALDEAKVWSVSKPLLVGDLDCVADAISIARSDININVIERPCQGLYRPGSIDLIDLDNVAQQDVSYGRVSAEAGEAGYQYIEYCIKLALAGEVDAVVTGPINKEALNLSGHDYSGHTEIFADLTGARDYCMMLVDGRLRVSHVSTHVSLRNACDMVTQERVGTVIRLTHDALVRMGIPAPRIAVAGLNPHAGEGGLFGTEERDVIAPAVREAQSKGIDARGPIAPDTVFARTQAGQYDAVVAMYHDQGHIAVKTSGFKSDDATGQWTSMSGVNVTLGLPIIRTSVDHGTAFEIAGLGRANPQSMIQAIELAAMLARGA